MSVVNLITHSVSPPQPPAKELPSKTTQFFSKFIKAIDHADGGDPLLSAKNIEPFDGLGYPYTPSALNLLFLPAGLIKSVFAFCKAKVLGDKEGVIDASLKLSAFWANLLSTIMECFSFLSQLHVIGLWGWLGYATGIPGLILCFLEGGFETIGALRIARFLKRLPSSSQDNGTDEATLIEKDLRYLQDRYLHLTAQDLAKVENKQEKESLLVMKQKALARRIHSNHVKELETHIPSILAALQHKEAGSAARAEALAKGKELLNHVHIQTSKKLLMHGLGLLAIAVTSIGLLLVLLGSLYPLTFSLIALGVLLATARYCISAGVLPQKGWHFDAVSCLPECIQKKIRQTPLKQVPWKSKPTFSPRLRSYASFRRPRPTCIKGYNHRLWPYHRRPLGYSPRPYLYKKKSSKPYTCSITHKLFRLH